MTGSGRRIASRHQTRRRLAAACAVALLLGGAAAARGSGKGRTAEAEPPLIADGFLPVTHYGAVPDDGIDDTAALQRAIDAARDRGLVVLFPAGEYLVSDTLRAMQPVTAQGNEWRQDRRRANALVGSTQGSRPVLRLAENAAGFDDPASPKPVVWFWAQPRGSGKGGSARPQDEQPNISFNQVLKGIDIDLHGRGHSGAVGVRHAGSQGSTIEEVSIRAEGAFAGLYNLPGQGGGVYGLSVSGGRFGVWANHQSRYPVMAGVRLAGQTQAAIFWDGQSNLTVAGFSFERSGAGPVVTLQRGTQAHNRALTLVDGVIRGGGDVAIDNAAGRSLYLRDVAVNGFATVVRSGERDAVKAVAPLSRVHEYAYTGIGSESIIEGRRGESGGETVSIGQATEPMAAERIIARHLWHGPSASAEDADAVSITRYGARPDDGADDTAAIRRALENHRKVFVPKGTFTVTGTLRLGPQTQLFGVAKHLSVIQAGGGWDRPAGTPIITTADDAGATTSLSFLLIERPADAPGITLLEWRAGGASTVRDVMGGVYRTQSHAPAMGGSTYAIRGHGGGRWYGLAAEWNRMSPATRGPGYRHLLIEGTQEPLALYGLNIERGLSTPQSEILNARNVSIYSLKGESPDAREGSAVLQVSNSRNVSLFGYSGNAAPRNNAVLRVVDSDDYLLANVMPVRPEADFETVMTQQGADRMAVEGLHPAAIVRRGHPATLY